MTATRSNLSTTEACSSDLSAAVDRLDDRLTAEPTPDTDPRADLGFFEEAFDRIDRQLDGVVDAATPDKTAAVDDTAQDSLCAGPVAKSVSEPPQPPRASLALVIPAPPIAAEIASTTAAAPDETDALWDKPEDGGTALERLVGTMQNLWWLRRAIDSRSAKVAQHMRWERVADVLRDATALCEELDLPTAKVRAQFALDAFESDRLDVLAREVRELVRHIHHDLHRCATLAVPPQRAWMSSVSLDERANRAFPGTASDVAAAGRCLAFGLHGAAIFHLLRAAERGRIALARSVRVDGRAQHAADWSATVVALQKRAAALSRWPAGPARKAAKDFLTAMLSDARELEDIRRRMQEGESFEECHAVAAWLATRDFLAAAAQRVSETRDTVLSADDFI